MFASQQAAEYSQFSLAGVLPPDQRRVLTHNLISILYLTRDVVKLANAGSALVSLSFACVKVLERLTNTLSNFIA